jgi:murein DD-endopeptidase MepM/ murein hydrolase activator NlpD
MKIKINALSVLVLVSIGLLTSFLTFSAFNSNVSNKPVTILPEDDSVKEVVSEQLFGLSVDDYEIESSTIKRNEFLSTILERYQIDKVTMAKLVKASKPVFDVRNMAANKPYTVFLAKDNSNKAEYFVYQPNAVDYIVYDLRDSVRVYKEMKPTRINVETVGGTITSSLYEALQESGANPDMAVYLSNIFGGVIDFYSIKEGDSFKIEYDQQYVGDEPIGSLKIRTAMFSQNGKEYQAHYFKPDGASDGNYYDENGNSLQRFFLKAPLKFSRITSRFSKNRLHPVQKVWKAHLGTDYAAPAGTPIIATGDGVVEESRFTSANGNYVKIKHNKTYSTQYLHMNRTAVKRGQRVKQGQVIGYVGSTGLATGPHVCYRFWKNGVQVDPLRQNFQRTDPIADEYMLTFRQQIQHNQTALAAIGNTNNTNETRYLAYEESSTLLYKYFSNEASVNNL